MSAPAHPHHDAHTFTLALEAVGCVLIADIERRGPGCFHAEVCGPDGAEYAVAWYSPDVWVEGGYCAYLIDDEDEVAKGDTLDQVLRALDVAADAPGPDTGVIVKVNDDRDSYAHRTLKGVYVVAVEWDPPAVFRRSQQVVAHLEEFGDVPIPGTRVMSDPGDDYVHPLDASRDGAIRIRVSQKDDPDAYESTLAEFAAANEQGGVEDVLAWARGQDRGAAHRFAGGVGDYFDVTIIS